MKSILLVASSAADSNRVVTDAATVTGRGFRQVDTSRRAFELLNRGVHDVDLVVIDVDPDIHAMAVLEAIGGCKDVPPVIVVTGLEEEYMCDVARRHGAAACIGKPFSAAQLVSVIDELFPTPTPHYTSCDAWGHPYAKRKRAFSVHAA